MPDADREGKEEGQAQTPQRILSDVENYSLALEAMQAIADAVKTKLTPSHGTGVMPCPRCAALGRAGSIRWSYEKRKGTGRGARSFAAQCEHAGCITFSGH